jgi:hypothetical protein
MKLVGNDIKIEVKDEIFNCLYSDDNTMLGKLSNSDRVYILYLLKQYYLDLRKKIDISDNITFGLELEFDSMFSDIIDENLYDCLGDEWCVVPEGSIINGGEINSPILTDTEKNWKDLEKGLKGSDKHLRKVAQNIGKSITSEMDKAGKDIVSKTTDIFEEGISQGVKELEDNLEIVNTFHDELASLNDLDIDT